MDFFRNLFALGFLFLFNFSECTHQKGQGQLNTNSRSKLVTDGISRFGANRQNIRLTGTGINPSNRRSRARAVAMGLVSGNGKAFGRISNRDGTMGLNVRQRGQMSDVNMFSRRNDRLSANRDKLNSFGRAGHHDNHQSPHSTSKIPMGDVTSSVGNHGQDVIIIRGQGQGRNSMQNRQNTGNVVDLLSTRIGKNIRSNSGNIVKDRNHLNQLISQRQSQIRGGNSMKSDGMVILPLSLIRSLLRNRRTQRKNRPSNSARVVIVDRGRSQASALSSLLNSPHFEIERKEPKFLGQPVGFPIGKGTLLPPGLSEESLLFLQPLLSQLGLNALGTNVNPSGVTVPLNPLPAPVINLNPVPSPVINLSSAFPMIGTGSGLLGNGAGNSLGLLTLGLLEFPELEGIEEILKDVADKQIKSNKRRAGPKRKKKRVKKKTQPKKVWGQKESVKKTPTTLASVTTTAKTI